MFGSLFLVAGLALGQGLVITGPQNISPGQPVVFQIDGPPAAPYWVDLSISGTSPGYTLWPTGRVVPLNPEYCFYTHSFDLALPDVFVNFIGTTDASGHATAVFHVPNAPWIVGLSLFCSGITSDYSSPDYVGEIANATVTTFTAPTGAITAPTNLTITGSTATSVSLAWDDNSTNESGFVVSRRIGSASYVVLGTTEPSATTYVDTTVSPSTTYTYRVRGTNNTNNSNYSNTVTVTTPAAAPSIPSAPSGLQANASSSTTVNLTWTDNSSSETATVVQRRPSGGSFTTIVTLGTNATNYSDTTVAAGTTYDYRVAASNVAGTSSWSNTANVTTPSATGSTTNSLTQFGITWTFASPVPYGQFANGDYWVVGPVTIVGISPLSSNVSGRIRHGAQINTPGGDTKQEGLDSKLYQSDQDTPGWGNDYVAALNVAYQVSAQSPLVVTNGKSLLSTISLDPPLAASSSLKSAAVLTVLASPPPAGSFRPPYAGNAKPLWNKSQIDYSKLANLAPIAGTPTLSDIEAKFERVWLDHISGWLARHLFPSDNMPGYGREMADDFGTATLMANLNFTVAQKEKLVIRLIQLGIDAYGMHQSGGDDNWRSSGGIGSGRKWRILFAGIMLNDANLKNVAANGLFGEDDSTFVVAETSPGVYNWGYGGYNASHVGLVEWGNEHRHKPQNDNASWNGDPYRVCCTANAWVAQVLSARIMGAMTLWNHPPLFAYQDRYMNVMATNGSPSWQRSWTTWPGAMWDHYRPQF